VCTPRTPRCEACPLARWCRAHALGRVEAYPPLAPRRATEAVRRAVALIVHRGRVLMIRRGGSLLDGMWEPPGVELDERASAGGALAEALATLGVHARLAPHGTTVRHVITHRRIAVEVWRGTSHGAAPRVTRRLRWVDPGAPAVALTALGRRLAKLAAS